MKFSIPHRCRVQVDDVCRQSSLHLVFQETGRGPSRGRELKRSRSIALA